MTNQTYADEEGAMPLIEAFEALKQYMTNPVACREAMDGFDLRELVDGSGQKPYAEILDTKFGRVRIAYLGRLTRILRSLKGAKDAESEPSEITPKDLEDRLEKAALGISPNIRSFNIKKPRDPKRGSSLYGGRRRN